MTTTAPGRRPGAGHAAVVVVAAAALLIGLLPIPNWIENERLAPWYGEVARGWLIGSAGLIVAAALLARLPGTAGFADRLAQLAARLDPASPRVLLGVGVAAFLVYFATSALIFSGRPLFIDEMVNVLQARIYAGGRPWAAAPADAEFRSIFHMIERDGRVFGHFPPGWPILLAIGEVLRIPTVVPALVGAGTVVGFGRLLRSIEGSPAVRGGALVLFAFAPFHLFLASSLMNHEASLLWIVWSVAFWSEYAAPGGTARRWLPLAAGAAAGMAAITRPAEGSALILCLGLGTLLLTDRPIRDRLVALATAAIAVAGPLAVLIGINVATTGGPFTSGYQLLWGPNVGPGFHPAPWGPPHTPVRGFELISLYFLRLNDYLFDGPFPGLLPALLAVALLPRMTRADRVLLGFTAVLVAVYFGYWHDGFYLGPRFMLPLVAVAALWTARLPRALGSLAGARGRAAAILAVAGGLAIALGSGIPERAGRYRASFAEMRWDLDSAATEAGVANAIVLVQESWGSQLVARLWGLGVSRPDAERLYHSIDACILEQTLSELERGPRDPAGATAALERLTADSAKLVRSPLSPDTTERALPGTRYPRACLARILDDRVGTGLLPIGLLARRPDVQFVRSLPTRNAAFAAAHPDKALFRMFQDRRTGAPIFHPIRRDSLMAAPADSSGQSASRSP